MHVIVRRHGAPGCGRAVDDGDERENCPGQGCAVERGGCGVVGVRPRLAKDDHEDDEKDQPGVALVDQDGLQADEGDGQRHDGQDHNADGQRYMPVRDGVESQAARDARHGGPADLLHRVQRRDDLVRPPPETVARHADLAQSRRSAKRRAVARHGPAQDGCEDVDRDGLSETKSKLPPEEACREARRVESAGRPQQEHGQFFVPGDGFLVFGSFAVDSFTLNAQFLVQSGFEASECGEDAMILVDPRVVIQLGLRLV